MQTPLFVNVAVLVAGIILGQLLAWLRGFRGHRIVVYRDSQTPQISIENRVDRALSIDYKGLPVRQLVLNRFRIWNAGTATVSEPRLKIVANFEADEDEGSSIEPFIEVEVDDPDGLTTAKIRSPHGPTNLSEPWEIRIQRHHFNPKRAYREEQVELSVFSSHKLIIKVEGGGPEWRSSLRDGTKSFYFLPKWASNALLVWLVILGATPVAVLAGRRAEVAWAKPLADVWIVGILGFIGVFLLIRLYEEIHKRF